MWRSRERIALATLSKLEEPQVVKAVQMRKVLGTDRFSFSVEADGKEYVALFARFPDASPSTGKLLS